jgi:hypothetical protein
MANCLDWVGEKIMKVYIVMVSDVESSSVISVHRTKAGALEAWNKSRLLLIDEFERMVEYTCKKQGFGADMYERMINNLKEKDPEKLNNYPHEEPSIHEYDVVE